MKCFLRIFVRSYVLFINVFKILSLCIFFHWNLFSFISFSLSLLNWTNRIKESYDQFEVNLLIENQINAHVDGEPIKINDSSDEEENETNVSLEGGVHDASRSARIISATEPDQIVKKDDVDVLVQTNTNPNSKVSNVKHAKKHTFSKSIRKRFRCQLCTYSSDQKGHLNRHFRTHTGEKPFQCNRCSKRFTRPEGLKRHAATHYHFWPM